MSNDNFSVFEISISQTQFCTIRVRASSEEEALEHVQQNPSVTDDLLWDKPDYEYSQARFILFLDQVNVK